MASSRGQISERVRRALYAVSRGVCYEPECVERVIVLKNGQPVFVGQIAHIVAAVESGPRGTEQVDDREGFDNLLVLCGRHHRLIDDEHTSEFYSVATLRQWKLDHEAEFDEAARAELNRLPDLADVLPELLTDLFRDTTAELNAAVDQLEIAGHLAHETALLLHTALQASGPVGPALGEGVPSIKQSFEDVYDAVGGASFLGAAITEAYPIGPGFVQHLRGGSCGHPAVICALRNRQPVIITGDLWNAISRVSDGHTNGADGVGLPIGPKGPYIGPNMMQIATAGGAWSDGTMVRGMANGDWRWIPNLAFDQHAAVDTEIAIGSVPRLDCRLRLVAHMPGVEAEPRLTAGGRRRLAAAFAERAMVEPIAALAADRIDVPGELRWRQTNDLQGRNDSLGASYECVIYDSGELPAIRGRAQYLMPQLMAPGITSVVDLELDFDGCQPEAGQPNTPVLKRLSLNEIVDFLTAAWHIAFDVLPLALDEDISLPNPGGRPRVSLHLISEHPPNTGPKRTFRLGDLVDLSPFGTTQKTRLSQLDIAVIGRGSLPQEDVRDLVRTALRRMAEDAGFDRADLVTWA
ncbi:hypothetical protein AB0L64_06090 [Kribbella sp. NPDC051936]|uniref:hypothetical protein n=1 Tax=Kribbella sp. NPDC051936 TaxID=3154946 RepID=UPI0034365832